jgi:hypothetical protein
MRCIWACLSISVSLLAQQANDTVSGTVLNSETGELVKYALVTLMSVPKFDSGHPPQQPVTPVQRFIQTDGSGNFQFNGRPSGGTSAKLPANPCSTARQLCRTSLSALMMGWRDRANPSKLSPTLLSRRAA